MSTATYRSHRKLNNGSYELVHLETESGIVLRPNGRTVEQDLRTLEKHVSNTNNPHKVTLGQLGAAAASHTHVASAVTAGTLAGKVLANAAATATVTTAQLRNIYAGTSDIGAGAALTSGCMYLVYE